MGASKMGVVAICVPKGAAVRATVCREGPGREAERAIGGEGRAGREGLAREVAREATRFLAREAPRWLAREAAREAAFGSKAAAREAAGEAARGRRRGRRRGEAARKRVPGEATGNAAVVGEAHNHAPPK